MKHTITPWVVNGLQIHSKNKHETLIADIFDQNESAQANSKFIVRACNSHNELLEAANEGMEELPEA